MTCSPAQHSSCADKETTLTQAEDEAFEAYVGDQLDAVERRLSAITLTAANPFLAEAAEHIIAAGGKRFRPMLVAVTSQLGPQPNDAAAQIAAVVVELTHVASLYHDDVMDDAALRRGVPSANAAYGNSTAIMVGDWLFARASNQVATLGNDFVRMQADTFAELVTGQIDEMRGPQPGHDAMLHYLNVVAGKTGALIRTSAVFGAMTSGASREVLDALAQFGMQIGVVFQLADDLMDIMSDDSGKAPGTDLREGVSTLPTLMLAASEDSDDDELKSLIAGDLADDDVLARTLAMLRANHVIEEARADIVQRAELARKQLDLLPDGAATRALSRLCDEVVSRSN
ncbi:Heptaprenyl diphosphate synthase component II [Propionibacterium freudenreichii]|nr:Heptaprenyl diphosphate synthase component II [Propionibacterium freudenreichii]CEG99768.1 Heptaprenyl diphosphate synthase component II [Propionibacterium freudenreichii]CEH09309.1 Heptaprenyl diphosphate synthase component II [Propionibacterium freudenreichii]CEI22444.1 Heptaprenyl diphosphate synthase component II [Propionibacterium freudenreichii]CEI32821.1 Heptaprenyl diphosphate synthase component II [Propionibacterium freudenreichii]